MTNEKQASTAKKKKTTTKTTTTKTTKRKTTKTTKKLAQEEEVKTEEVVKPNFFDIVSRQELPPTDRQLFLYTDKRGHACFTASKFNGKKYAHLRYHIPQDSGTAIRTLKPTEKGISMNEEQFKSFMEKVPEMLKLWGEVDDEDKEELKKTNKKSRVFIA